MSGLFLWAPHNRDTALLSTSLNTPLGLSNHLMYDGQHAGSCSRPNRNSHRKADDDSLAFFRDEIELT